MIAQQNTYDVDELGSTFFRETQQTSQLIYGFEVFQDYRVALQETQQRKAIHTVDENGIHLTKYCCELRVFKMGKQRKYLVLAPLAPITASRTSLQQPQPTPEYIVGRGGGWRWNASNIIHISV